MNRGIFTTLAAMAVLALTGTAHASTVGFTGDVLTYTAAPGEANNVTFVLGTQDFECGTRPAPCIDVMEAGATITSFSASRCADDGYGTVECDVPVSVVANLGDGDDSAFGWDGPSTINGGAGNDPLLQGGRGTDQISGGPGSDALFGGDGGDTLDGGDGDDYLEGFGGLSPTSPVSTGGTDVYIGGPGKDYLDYAGRTEPMSISLDGAANDGAAGEADNVGTDVEQVRGGGGADHITGSAAANLLDGWDGDDTIQALGGDDTAFGGNGEDTVSGGDGLDTIEGGDGDDAVDGGAGVDTLYGDEMQVCIPSDCARGQDTIAARDGTAETVNCGPGEDAATLDAGDRIPEYGDDLCEQIARDAITGSTGGGGTTGTTGGGGTGAGTGSAADIDAPRIGTLRVATLRRGRSTTIRYTLSEAAAVTFRIERKRGARWVRVRGTLRHGGRAGSNSLRFTGRVGGRRLGRGSYRLVALARDAAGNLGTARRAAFRVTG